MSDTLHRIYEDTSRQDSFSPDESPLNIQLTRRQLLAAGLAVALSSVDEADHNIMEQRWPHGSLTLQNLVQNPEPGAYPEGLVCVPGYGSYHGYTFAAEFRESNSIPPALPISYLVYPNQGYTIRGAEQLIAQNAKRLQLQYLSLYGHSMGGPTGLVALAGVGLPIRRVILNCSPFDVNDAFNGSGARLVAEATRLHLYRGEVIGKYLANLFNQIRHHGYAHTWSNLGRASYETMHGASPELLSCQAALLKDIHLNRLYDKIARLMMPDSEVLFCMPEEPNSDTTVKDTQAYAKWHAFFAHMGIQCTLLKTETPGHAHTAPAVSTASGWLRKTTLAKTT